MIQQSLPKNMCRPNGLLNQSIQLSRHLSKQLLRLSELLRAIHDECERCLNELVRLDTAFPLENLFLAAFIMELVQRRWTVRYA